MKDLRKYLAEFIGTFVLVLVACGTAIATKCSVENTAGYLATAAAFGLETDERGLLGDERYRTADPKVFACGDMRRGASLVVWAIAEGRACARIVDRELEGYTNL